MKNFLILISISVLETLPALAEAAHESGAHGHETGGHHPSLFWPWVNFLIYVGILWFFLHQPIAQMWASRREFLKSLREKGVVELKASETKLKQAQELILSVEQQGKDLEKTIIRDGEREGAHLITEARARAERTVKQAEASAAAERRSAEVLMRRELAESVMARATEKIKRELNADSDRSIRKSVLGSVRQLVQ